MEENKTCGTSMEEKAALMIAHQTEAAIRLAHQNEEPIRPSVVEVYFPERGVTLPYYNDSFPLRVGDGVYVDGKLEGMLGKVKKVSYNFKIDLDVYRRVIMKVDTEVHGTFYYAHNHYFTVESQAIPVEKVRSWLIAPKKSEKGIVSGWDNSSFPLNDLNRMEVTPAIGLRGMEYYLHQNVIYLALDGTKGYAIVEGNSDNPYEVEFHYEAGSISRLTCNCFCMDKCKHMVAVMMLLRELLEVVQAVCGTAFAESGYFAAISKPILMDCADLEHRPSFVL